MEPTQDSFRQRLIDIYLPHLRKLEEERNLRTVQGALERERLFPGQDLSPENLVKFHMAYKDLTGLDPMRGPAPEPRLSNQFLTNEPSPLAQPRGVYGQQMLDTLKQAEAEAAGKKRLAEGIYAPGGAEDIKYQYEVDRPTSMEQAWLSGDPENQALVRDYFTKKQAGTWTPSQWINAKKYDIITRYINNPQSISREELKVAGLDENYLSKAMELVRNDLTLLSLPPDKKAQKVIDLMETLEAAEKRLGTGIPAPPSNPNDPAELAQTFKEMGIEFPLQAQPQEQTQEQPNIQPPGSAAEKANLSNIYSQIRSSMPGPAYRARRTWEHIPNLRINATPTWTDIRRPERNEIIDPETGIIYKTPSKRYLQ